MNREISRWRSADAEGRFRSIEDDLIAEQWPNGIDTVDVDTSFGTTHHAVKEHDRDGAAEAAIEPAVDASVGSPAGTSMRSTRSVTSAAACIAAERARIIPRAAVDVVEGAGHEVSWSHVERCLTYLTSSTSR